MKIVSYFEGGRRSYGLILDSGFFSKEGAEEAVGKRLPRDPITFLARPGLAQQVARVLRRRRSREQTPTPSSHVILPPLTKPPKILCLGLNYLDHAEEQGLTPPKEPILFMKPRTAITGPFDDILCPRFVKKLDYEAELAVVIGVKAKNVGEKEALDCVAGYMVMNDVSARDIQMGDGQWTRGKSFDTFAPIGPWLVARSELPDPHHLSIITKVNGEVRQNSSTAKMALKVNQIISSISRVMTLEPGDIIATGTPSGVGIFLKPKPRFLRHGDVVEINIEKVGTIRNKVRFV